MGQRFKRCSKLNADWSDCRFAFDPNLTLILFLTLPQAAAVQYPVTATQWHPEKNAFEWARDLDIPHDKGAIAVTQAVANFVVDEVRDRSSVQGLVQISALI